MLLQVVGYQPWAQLGSNLDLPLKNTPVEHFRQGLECGGGLSATP